jgi:uncharacterized membrane protein
MENEVLQIVMRFIHIVSAIVLVGGNAYIATVMLSSLRLVEDSLRNSILKLAADRFTRIVWIGIAGLVVSGAYNWVLLAPMYKAMGPVGNALIGSKVLLALILFLLVWANRVGLTKLSVRAYLILNLHLAAAVIVVAVVLRTLRLAHGG